MGQSWSVDGGVNGYVSNNFCVFTTSRLRPSVHWLLFLIDTNCQQETMKRWLTIYCTKSRNALSILLNISNKEYIGNSQGNAEMVYFVLTNDQ